VVRRFDAVPVLAGLDLLVRPGSVYLLVGSGGTGKSTLLRILVGLLAPDRGRVRVAGLSPREHGDRVRAGVGYVPGIPAAAYGWMRVGELIRHHAAYYPAWEGRYARRLRGDLELAGDREVRALAPEEERRLRLLLALAHRPPILLLEDPLRHQDDPERARILEVLRRHLDGAGCACLLAARRTEGLEELADVVGTLRDGRVVAERSAASGPAGVDPPPGAGEEAPR